MMHYEERLASFRRWKYNDKSSCSPTKMALAGFYYVTRNCAQCYWCDKMLDGWEAHDDPWEEHKSHASYCPFVQRFESPPPNITILDLIYLKRDQQILKLKNEHDRLCKEVDSIIDSKMSRK